MANSQPKHKLSSLLGDYGNYSDNELDDSMGTNGSSAKRKTNTADKYETDWTQCIDAKTGHPYYWNILTKEVTWEIPDEYEKFLKHNATKYKNTSSIGKWAVCHTDGEPSYYFNAITREISWEKPADFIENLPSKQTKSTKQPAKSQNLAGKPIARPTENTKKYPFPELENEKIELITSFDGRTESSSEDESNGKSNNNHKKTKLAFNLVADYSDNSDDETATIVHDEDNKSSSPRVTKKTESSSATRPLFAAISTTTAIDAATTTTNDVYTIAVQSILKSALNEPESIESSHMPADQPQATAPPPAKKVKSTFASIITGGRSPSQDISNDMADAAMASVSDPITDESASIETEIISSKLLKRKRRIEFNTTRSLTSTPSTADQTEESTALHANDNDGEGVEGDKDKGDAELSDKNSNSNETSDAVAIASPTDDTQNAQIKLDICNLKDTLEAKVKFLCQDRAIVSPVQIIQIQLQILLEAYDAEALTPVYLFKWLQTISADLIRLEVDAAPSGWKCFWDRCKSQYCYENEITGHMQWEYPVPIEEEQQSASETDDEMDICTTPPPNDEHHEAIGLLNVDPPAAPAPPSWHASKSALIHTHLISGEPLPPGIQVAEHKDIPTDDINQELASFYSDLASMDAPLPATSGTPNSEQVPPPSPLISGADAVDPDTIDDKKKKKKKKMKKLEPWRSGNLESWINKWQAAQKELDG